MKFIVFLVLGMFALSLSLRPDWVIHYSSGLIQPGCLQDVKWITWLLLTADWIYILWYNKKPNERYRSLIDQIGEEDAVE